MKGLPAVPAVVFDARPRPKVPEESPIASGPRVVECAVWEAIDADGQRLADTGGRDAIEAVRFQVGNLSRLKRNDAGQRWGAPWHIYNESVPLNSKGRHSIQRRRCDLETQLPVCQPSNRDRGSRSLRDLSEYPVGRDPSHWRWAIVLEHEGDEPRFQKRIRVPDRSQESAGICGHDILVESEVAHAVCDEPATVPLKPLEDVGVMGDDDVGARIDR